MNSVRKVTPNLWPIGKSINFAAPPDPIQIKEAGVQCVELSWRQRNMDLFEPENRKKSDAYVQHLRDLGIEIWSIHIPFGADWDLSVLDEGKRKESLEKIERILAIASEWDIGIAILHPSFEPIPDEERSQRLQQCKRSLQSLSETAQVCNVQIAVECLPRTCLGNSAEEMAYLLHGIEPLGICVDVNHIFHETPDDFIRKLGERIITTHISDDDGLDEKHWMPGQGVIAWNQVIQALVDIGYQGAFMYEVGGSDPSDVVENWNQLLHDFEMRK